MFKKLNELELTEEQKAVFKEVREWAFMCEMGTGYDWKVKENMVKYLNDNLNLNIVIIDYNPDFFNANDTIRIK